MHLLTADKNNAQDTKLRSYEETKKSLLLQNATMFLVVGIQFTRSDEMSKK